MQAIQMMSALAQSTRLEVFTQLARTRPDGLSAGALAERVGTPANTMSAHLAILSRAGLITPEKAGRHVIYKADPDAVRYLALFLTHDCCFDCASVTGPNPDETTYVGGVRARDILGNESISTR